MSERPPAGWDTQGSEATTARAAPAPPTADELLAGHLHRRGAHLPPRTLAASIVGRVAETVPERRWRLTLAAWRPRVAVAVSGMTLALVAGLLFFGSPAPRTSTAPVSPTPTPSPTAASGPMEARWDPTQRALTPPELLQVLSMGLAPGTVLIVDDQIVGSGVVCLGGTPPSLEPGAASDRLGIRAEHCPTGRLANDPTILIEPPAGGHLPFADNGGSSTPIMGPLALEVTSGSNLMFLGGVVSGGARLSFLRAPDLAHRSAMGGLFVLQAWLWATPPAPCPVPGRPKPIPTSELGLPAPSVECSPTDWLTDTETTNPERRAGIEFPVQHGAYDAYAYYPSNTPQANPSYGIYLVRDWAGYGEILARLDPLPIPSADAVAPSTPTPGGIVVSVDELVGRVLSGSLAPGSVVVASIPVSAVSVLSPSAAGTPDDPTRSRWTITAGSRYVRVDGVTTSGIVGNQAFLVEPSQAVRLLGPAVVARDGKPLIGLTVGDGLSVVHGWLRIGPPLPCPRPQGPTRTGILGEHLAWSQCPGTWILPSADDPWAGPPNNVQATDGSGAIRTGDSSVPPGTLHVQDGADGAGLAPHEGVWLVRLVASARPCPPGTFCTIQLPNEPLPGASWYELVGPVAGPDRAAGAQAPSSAIVLSQDRLVVDVTSGVYPTGSIVIARATIAPVILPSFPPDQGTIAGKIGPLSVHWASDPSLGVSASHTIALRVRADGHLDYLGSVDLIASGGPYEASAAPSGPGLALVLIHGWLYRSGSSVPCVPVEPGPSTPPSFRSLDGRRLAIGCDQAWILSSAADTGPDGSLVVQNGQGAPGVPTEGLFLIRAVPCSGSPSGLEGCGALQDVWEFVGPVVEPRS